MATVHLIYGYLGAGKTTFAKKLEHELPALRINADEWVTKLFSTDNLDPDTMLRPVNELLERYWMRCVELGMDVVLDFGFWTRQSRDETRAKIAALGAEHRLYFLVVTDEVAWARIEKRNQDLNGSFFFNRNAYDTLKTLRGFDPLGEDEPHIIIDTSSEERIASP